MDEGERHWQWHATIKLLMGEGGERCKEIEGADHKGNNNAMVLAAMASVEKGGGSNGGCHH